MKQICVILIQHILHDFNLKGIENGASSQKTVLVCLFFLQAYLYSEAKMIYGVEIDATFCQLQEKVIEKYNMKDRVQVNQSVVR